jgi:hypothetical protein
MSKASKFSDENGAEGEPDPNADIVEEWISFFLSTKPEACIVVTKRGADGAVTFQMENGNV